MNDKHATKASAIMDEACLGEPFVSNGTDKALREAIASALRSAADEERDECAKVADVHEASDCEAGKGAEDSRAMATANQYYGYAVAANIIARAIRSRGNSNG